MWIICHVDATVLQFYPVSAVHMLTSMCCDTHLYVCVCPILVQPGWRNSEFLQNEACRSLKLRSTQGWVVKVGNEWSDGGDGGWD